MADSSASVTTKRRLRPMALFCFYGMILATVALGSSLLFRERFDPSWPVQRGAPKPRRQLPTTSTLAAFALAPLLVRGLRRNRA